MKCILFCIMSDGIVIFKCRLPQKTCAVHTEWLKYFFLRELFERAAGNDLNNKLQQIDSFPRISVSFTRIKKKFQFIITVWIKLPPVWKSGCMVQTISCCN